MNFAITVLMTTYNCGKYISQAIKSILNQTFKDFEFLIIDDGSSDNTDEIVKSFEDGRIVYKKNEHLGRSKALNFGLSFAKYDWISIMDADDIAHPLRFEKQVKSITNFENEICFTDAAFFKEDRILYTLKNNFDNRNINDILALHGHFTNSTFLFNRKHIIKFGGYNENIEVFEDYDLWLRIKNDSRFLFVTDFLQYVRIRNESLTNSNIKNLDKKVYLLQEPYYNDIKYSFGIYGFSEQTKLKAWREFFYGDKKLARVYWNQINFWNLNYRVLIAYILTFLPENILIWFKRKRFRLRLQYWVQKFTTFKGLDKEFKKKLREVS
ncbi:MAG: glycosyltransferase family A protein [Ignavibacterium sp.]|jgi:glycosyltransferase involved in cell wall biosynthesis|nr:glycosyltransferase family A protein [Ignavibacterium sp.]